MPAVAASRRSPGSDGSWCRLAIACTLSRSRSVSSATRYACWRSSLLGCPGGIANTTVRESNRITSRLDPLTPEAGCPDPQCSTSLRGGSPRRSGPPRARQRRGGARGIRRPNRFDVTNESGHVTARQCGFGQNEPEAAFAQALRASPAHSLRRDRSSPLFGEPRNHIRHHRVLDGGMAGSRLAGVGEGLRRDRCVGVFTERWRRNDREGDAGAVTAPPGARDEQGRHRAATGHPPADGAPLDRSMDGRPTKVFKAGISRTSQGGRRRIRTPARTPPPSHPSKPQPLCHL